MPDSCAAWGCTNRRTVQSKSQGITFHRFPKENDLRRQWEVAARRRGFSATKSSVLCSEHFKPEDIDATGQTVRIREGAKPSVFSFQSPLQKPLFTRTTQTSKKAQESLTSGTSRNVRQTEPPPPPPSPPPPDVDHCYALPASPADLKARLMDALARVESLERELRNMKDRERRAKNTVFGLLEDLRGKNLINEELKDKLDSYSDLPVHLLSKQGNDYTKDQREFALTLHLHGPKVYNYLRKSLHLQLPHPHTLQRWMSSIDAKHGLDSTSVKITEEEEEADDASETLTDAETDFRQNPLTQNITVSVKDVDTARLSEDNTGES
ncbi:THAP domain-containing protein 6 isoform X1 [Phycodurus eques]|uniref:THAP domain-containing protein 6 isoform X1 n=1 Tax=Phycodurus eques TaxID=693459 RepID=UPI002ACDB546|nr:THAP domain-containing protein 6 isoform X1 [Phycodurus eques]XP_061528064.1 THAP domain-containing protein 6 isoform X1 [Phycodurus eques]